MLHFAAKKVVLTCVAAAALSFGTAAMAPAAVLINELDSDTAVSDVAELNELFNTDATKAVSRNGLVLTSSNGSNNQSYISVDLDGQSIPAGGYLVIGNPGVPNVSVIFDPGTQGLLQNG